MKKKFLMLISVLFYSIINVSCSYDDLKEDVKIKKSDNEVKTNIKNTDVSKSETTLKLIGSISSAEASEHIGDSISVRGYVVDVYLSDKVAYLNFDKKFPKNTFTCTIFRKYFPEFGDLTIYKDKFVEVNGKISVFKNKPQMILYSKDQIEFLNE